jgi:cytochrome P450
MADIPDPFGEPRRITGVLGLPIETDPPLQAEYRELVEPFFLRVKQPAFITRVEGITDRLLTDALSRDTIEAVAELALPLQSQALTHAEQLGFANLMFAGGRDTVFEGADEVRLDRRPNPHVSFGFGVHLCLGAAHARTVMRTLLARLCGRVGRIEPISKHDRVEHTAAYDLPLGYDSLVVRFRPRGA